MAIDDDQTTPFLRDPAAAGQPGARFEGFAAAKRRHGPRWATPLLAAVAVFHMGVFGVMWAKSIWDLEALEKPRSEMSLAVAPPPPAPPPPPPGGAKQFVPELKLKKRVVKEIVAFRIEDKPPPDEVQANVGPGSTLTAGDYCDPATEECGTDPDGVRGSIGDVTLVTAPPPPRPPAPPAPPKVVAAQILEGQRIAGNSQISPDDVSKTELSRSGKTKVIGTFKICIATSGAISQVTQLKSTTLPAYDQKIASELKSWKYKPYVVNGQAVPVCTAVTFVYTQT